MKIARQSRVHKVLSPSLLEVIAASIPPRTLRTALTHTASSVRLAAFQSLESIVTSYSRTIEGEAEMWRFALPFAVKTEESKEYTSSILQCLSAFLDRLSIWEAKQTKATDSNSTMGELLSFVEGFLVNDVIVTKGTYPGTVMDKEGFTLALLDSVLAFATQDQCFNSDSCVVRNGSVFSRRRSSNELATMRHILACLVSREVFACLFALLHSVWDNTRLGAFRSLSKLVIVAEKNTIALPLEYDAECERTKLHVRAVFLASSPRQREADTGARILAYLYMSHRSEEEKNRYLGGLIDLVQARLLSMKESLKVILGGATNVQEHFSGNHLPLAHGIIHAMRLTVEHRRVLRKHLGENLATPSAAIFEHMTNVYCQGIQLSLSVVADVREGEMIDGMDDDMPFPRQSNTFGKSNESTPLNVNTGAIGANGTFSTITASDSETMQRYAMQRIVVRLSSHVQVCFLYHVNSLLTALLNMSTRLVRGC